MELSPATRTTTHDLLRQPADLHGRCLGRGILALLLAAFALREARVAGVGALGVMDGATNHQREVAHKLVALEARIQALESAPKPMPVPVEAPVVAPAEPAPAP